MNDEKDAELTRLLLARAGFTPDEAEMPVLVEAHKAQAAGARRLYLVAETRYASPALRFPADPPARQWDWE